LQNTNALFSDTAFDPSITIEGAGIPALRRMSGFPFFAYGFRTQNGKSIVAYWMGAHSEPGNVFPPFYESLTLENTGIERPVLINVVSGEIRPLEWKKGTTNVLESVPVHDSVLAIADESYFDWNVLPEAPSSLRAQRGTEGVKLTWEVHGGNPAQTAVERRIGEGSWQRIETLPATTTEFADAQAPRGVLVSYQVRALNSAGESAYSNVVRVK